MRPRRDCRRADAAASLGCVATTSPGGCQAAGKADWSPLAGREVVVLPDNDESGIAYAQSVVSMLAPAPACTVEKVDLAALTQTGA